LGFFTAFPDVRSATGRSVGFPVLAIIEFEGDRQVCKRLYFDTGNILRQLGVN